MKNFLLTLLLSTGFLAEAQPVTKLYAYSQVITPGIVRQREMSDEQGKPMEKKPTAAIQYYIYAAVKNDATVQFRQVWIKDQWYTIAASTVKKSPVKIEQPAAKILVPSTQQKIMQIDPGDKLTTSIKPAAVLARMMKKNALILCYTWNGKRYYLPLRTIPELEKVHAE